MEGVRTPSRNLDAGGGDDDKGSSSSWAARTSALENQKEDKGTSSSSTPSTSIQKNSSGSSGKSRSLPSTPQRRLVQKGHEWMMLTSSSKPKNHRSFDAGDPTTGSTSSSADQESPPPPNKERRSRNGDENHSTKDDDDDDLVRLHSSSKDSWSEEAATRSDPVVPADPVAVAKNVQDITTVPVPEETGPVAAAAALPEKEEREAVLADSACAENAKSTNEPGGLEVLDTKDAPTSSSKEEAASVEAGAAEPNQDEAAAATENKTADEDAMVVVVGGGGGEETLMEDGPEPADTVTAADAPVSATVLEDTTEQAAVLEAETTNGIVAADVGTTVSPVKGEIVRRPVAMQDTTKDSAVVVKEGLTDGMAAADTTVSPVEDVTTEDSAVVVKEVLTDDIEASEKTVSPVEEETESEKDVVIEANENAVDFVGDTESPHHKISEVVKEQHAAVEESALSVEQQSTPEAKAEETTTKVVSVKAECAADAKDFNAIAIDVDQSASPVEQQSASVKANVSAETDRDSSSLTKSQSEEAALTALTPSSCCDQTSVADSVSEEESQDCNTNGSAKDPAATEAVVPVQQVVSVEAKASVEKAIKDPAKEVVAPAEQSSASVKAKASTEKDHVAIGVIEELAKEVVAPVVAPVEQAASIEAQAAEKDHAIETTEELATDVVTPVAKNLASVEAKGPSEKGHDAIGTTEELATKVVVLVEQAASVEAKRSTEKDHDAIETHEEPGTEVVALVEQASSIEAKAAEKDHDGIGTTEEPAVEMVAPVEQAPFVAAKTANDSSSLTEAAAWTALTSSCCYNRTDVVASLDEVDAKESAVEILDAMASSDTIVIDDAPTHSSVEVFTMLTASEVSQSGFISSPSNSEAEPAVDGATRSKVEETVSRKEQSEKSSGIALTAKHGDEPKPENALVQSRGTDSSLGAALSFSVAEHARRSKERLVKAKELLKELDDEKNAATNKTKPNPQDDIALRKAKERLEKTKKSLKDLEHETTDLPIETSNTKESSSPIQQAKSKAVATPTADDEQSNVQCMDSCVIS